MRLKNLAVAATLAMGLATLALVMFSVPAGPIWAQAGEGASQETPASGETAILREVAGLTGIQAPDSGSKRRAPAQAEPATDALNSLQKEGLSLDRGPRPSGLLSVTDNVILNGDFENERDGSWSESSTHFPYVIVPEDESLTPPHSGSWAVWLGGTYSETGSIAQTVGVPSDEAILGYWVWIASEDVCGYDVGGALVDGTAVDAFWLCEDTNTHGWVKREVDLSSYASQTIQLMILAGTDGSLNSNLFVDDVTLGLPQVVEHRVFLPLALRLVGGGPKPFAPPCSASNNCEDYDTWGTAYGPLRPGEEYRAYPNDNNDYYYFRIEQTTSLTVRVTNYNATGQVLVRREDLSEVAKDFNVPPGADGEMTVLLPNLPAGKYFVQVFTSGGLQHNTLYSLKIEP